MGNTIKPHAHHNQHYSLKSDSIVGEGGLATVYKCKDRDTHKRVAIKRQTKTTTDLTPHDLSGLIQEAQILVEVAQLPESADHFLQLKEAFYDEEGRMCLVTDYLPGKDLGKVLQNYSAGMPEYRVKYYVREILQALQILHSHDIAHLDLKLENIFVEDQGRRVKLIDFGFAAKTTKHNFQLEQKEEVMMQIFRGSLRYVCPEVAAYQPCDAKKADVWAVGVITYALLSSNFPFLAPTPKELFPIIRSGVYTPLKNLSRQGQTFLDRMLAVDPAERATVDELLRDTWLSSRSNVF